MNSQYYLDKDKMVDVRVDRHNDGLYVSIYNDRTDHSIGFSCSKEELRDLADFFNRVYQVNNTIKHNIS